MWLRTDNGEKFAKTLFKEKNIISLPGEYLAVSEMERILQKLCKNCPST